MERWPSVDPPVLTHLQQERQNMMLQICSVLRRLLMSAGPPEAPLPLLLYVLLTDTDLRLKVQLAPLAHHLLLNKVRVKMLQCDLSAPISLQSQTFKVFKKDRDDITCQHNNDQHVQCPETAFKVTDVRTTFKKLN